MAKHAKQGKALTNPIRLSPRDPDGSEVIQVIVETPKGSRNKYAFDPDQRIFELKKVLPGNGISIRLRICSLNCGRRRRPDRRPGLNG
jgi:hypothetical protein